MAGNAYKLVFNTGFLKQLSLGFLIQLSLESMANDHVTRLRVNDV
jgi:hypothetical protein